MIRTQDRGEEWTGKSKQGDACNGEDTNYSEQLVCSGEDL